MQAISAARLQGIKPAGAGAARRPAAARRPTLLGSSQLRSTVARAGEKVRPRRQEALGGQATGTSAACRRRIAAVPKVLPPPTAAQLSGALPPISLPHRSLMRRCRASTRDLARPRPPSKT